MGKKLDVTQMRLDAYRAALLEQQDWMNDLERRLQDAEKGMLVLIERELEQNRISILEGANHTLRLKLEDTEEALRKKR